jgi:chemotaxis protein CheX
MTLEPEVLSEIVKTVWSALFEVELEEVGSDAGFDGPQLTALVRIEGASPCAVSVCAPEASARRVAARMFDHSEAEVDEAEILDAIGELANMCGGNAKAMVDGATALSLPLVGRTRTPEALAPGFRVTTRVVLGGGDDRIAVALLST